MAADEHPGETASRGRQPHARVVRMVFPDQTNHHGTMFGGEVLALMTAAASHAASRVTPAPVVLASTERIDFRAPILEGTIAEADAWVTRMGRTSLTIVVVVHGENLLTAERKRATEGQFVFVALDANGRPTPIEHKHPPRLEIPDTWTTERVQPGQANHQRRLIGGELMRLLDAVAFISATRQVRTALVTGRVDALDLDREIRVGDLLYVGARVLETGQRSLTVRTVVGVGSAEMTEPSAVTSGRFVMVQVA